MTDRNSRSGRPSVTLGTRLLVLGSRLRVVARAVGEEFQITESSKPREESFMVFINLVYLSDARLK